MSVKDKIAMWNSMTVNPNPPPVNPTKLVASEPHPKPKQQEKEKVVPISVPSHHSQEPPHPPSTGFNLKKTQSTEQPPQTIPHHVTQSSNIPEKPHDTVNPTQPKKLDVKQESQGSNIPKFNDIKKQLQAQTAGKGIYFAAPVAPPKKIQQVPANRATECQIEKDIPRVSVKEQAAKLAQFYEQKHLNQLKKNQEKEVSQTIQHNIEKEVIQQAAIQKEESNSLNIVNHELNVSLQHPQQKQKNQLPKANDTGSQHIDISIRGQNKNKMKKKNFDDED